MGFGRSAVRGVGVTLLIASVIGAIATLILGVFVMDRYNAYGEVAIPGSGRVHLPAGNVNISLHAGIVGTTGGMGLPVPPLRMTITGPAGVPQPVVTESIGTTTTINHDARIRIWVAEVVAEGDYAVTVDGQVGPFISPRLAFGYGISYGRWLWMFGALFVIGLFGIVVPGRLMALGRRGWRRQSAQAKPDVQAGAEDRIASTTPTDEGVRLEQLKTLTALRDSGALTQSEFEAEKRRLLRSS